MKSQQTILLRALTLLPKPDRKKGVFIVVLLIAASMLDFFSLASFVPVILLLINPDDSIGREVHGIMTSWIGVVDTRSLVLVLTFGALTLIFLKIRFSMWTTSQKAGYAYHVANQLAANLIARYLQFSYTRYAQADLAEETNRVTRLPLSFANNVLIPAGTFLSELVILILVVGAIAWYEQGFFLFVSLLITPMILLYVRRRRKMKKIGADFRKGYPGVLKDTLQIIEALPEIRVSGKSEFFRKRFRAAYNRLTNALSRDHTVQVGASRITEFVAAACVSALVAYALLTGMAYDKTLILLSLYAGASYRAIPSVNRMFTASLQMKSCEHIIEDLRSAWEEPQLRFVAGSGRLSFKDRIQLSGIRFSYPGQPYVFNDLSVEIKKGEKVLLTGKSGSGKTTLLLLLLRLLKENEGALLVDGEKITDAKTSGWWQTIGYIPQNPYIADGTIADNIAFGVAQDEVNHDKVRELVDMLGLSSWIGTLREKTQTNIGEKGIKISGGQRQRLAIARALYQDADLLLFDEITNQLDRETELEIMAAFDQPVLRGKTVILITHWPDLWKSFDQVYTIENGGLAKLANAEQQAYEH